MRVFCAPRDCDHKQPCTALVAERANGDRPWSTRGSPSTVASRSLQQRSISHQLTDDVNEPRALQWSDFPSSRWHTTTHLSGICAPKCTCTSIAAHGQSTWRLILQLSRCSQTLVFAPALPRRHRKSQHFRFQPRTSGASSGCHCLCDAALGEPANTAGSLPSLRGPKDSLTHLPGQWPPGSFHCSQCSRPPRLTQRCPARSRPS